MSEVQSRPSGRGRSSVRGRGGFRGAPRSKHPNGDSSAVVDHTADEGELAELKKTYRAQLSTLKEMFPDWTDMDLLLGLQDSDGDLERTIDKITEGNVAQFADVKKKTKDRSRSKVKDASANSADTLPTTRGSRGRGIDGPRAGRGRGERGRSGFRGGRGATNTIATTPRVTEGETSVPTAESTAWDNTSGPAETSESTGAWDQAETQAEKLPASKVSAAEPAAVAAEPSKASTMPGVGKTWASMFAAPKPAPAPPKPVAQVHVPVPESAPESTLPTTEAQSSEAASLVPPIADEVEIVPDVSITENKTPPVVSEDPEPQLTPSKDELTEENVEHLPDATEQPALTETVASTIDASSVIGNATPAGQSTPAALPRPPMGGYAATALKATATPGRSASYQRRLFEQHEAVVMPGHNAVDRAAVQFGSLGLNGDADADLDVDEEREAAETRQQPPQHSPTGQPRTSLPPVPRHTSASAEQAPLEAVPTPKQAPGLPPVPQQQSPSTTLGGAPGLTQGAPGNQQYNQFSRYGQSAEATAPTQQKSYDPFGHQAPHSTPFETYPSQSQGPSQQPQPAPSGLGGYTSTPNDLTSYYTTDHQRTQYQNYYNNSYGQPGQQPATSQDAGAGQQRAGSAFGSASGEPAFPASQAQQPQSRYTDAQNSGNNTPNPVSSGQHGAQSQQTGHNLHQQHSGHGGYGGYNHPYYSQPYYQSYMNQMNQYGGGYGNQGYGPYGGGGKSGMHNQPHYGYGMSPQSSFDQHSSSPANAGGFGHSSVQGREGGLGGGFGDYGRSGSTQPSSQQHGASGFGGASEGFGRQQSGFQSQSQYGQQQQQQSGQQSGTEDSLKPFGESKSNAGPSPSLNQPGRPGSATNTSGAGNAGLPAPQSHQQGFSGGYPNHLSGQNSQYGGGLGGLGGGHQGGQGHQGQHQAHQGQGYGFGGGYGGYNNSGGYNRGGWSSNYQGH